MYGDDRKIPASLVAAIVAALGDGWSHKVSPHNPDLTHIHGPNGEMLWFGKSWDHKGKVHVSAHYPPNDAYDVMHFSINVGETRGAEVITKEITRRLLPDYLPELERVVADNARRADNRERRQVLAKELAAMVGGYVEDGPYGNETSAGLPYQSDGPWGAFHIDAKADGGRVELRNLTVNQLRAIAAMFGK